MKKTTIIVLVIVSLILLIGAYFMVAYIYGLWPFSSKKCTPYLPKGTTSADIYGRMPGTSDAFSTGKCLPCESGSTMYKSYSGVDKDGKDHCTYYCSKNPKLWHPYNAKDKLYIDEQQKKGKDGYYYFGMWCSDTDKDKEYQCSKCVEDPNAIPI
jgi:hypothetical protein